MRTLFLAWQDPKNRSWFPIGRLTFEAGKFTFVYTQGARNAAQTSAFQPLYSFPDFDKGYQSEELFPLFANRVMRPSRPDYKDYLEYLNIPQHSDDPMAILSRSGGKKATDHFEVFPCPEPDENGLYHIHFFLHGLRHRSSAAIERVDILKAHEQLYIMHDVQNPHDPQALALRTDDCHLIGYCPRYLAQDIHELLKQDSKLINVHVERVNPVPAPIQLRLLCSITAEWPSDFHPFSSNEYQPLKLSLQSS
jgi:HIRAN domain